MVQNSHNEPQVAQVDIGQLLMAKRLEKGVSVKEAAKYIKLSAPVVEKLEEGQFTDIGTPVYVRGYLGLYAKYLGLDAADIIALYNVQYPTEEVHIKPSVGQALTNSKKQKKRHSKTLSALIVLAVIAGLLYAYQKTEKLVFPQSVKNIIDDSNIPELDNNQLTASNSDTEIVNITSSTNDLDDITIDNIDALVTDLDLPPLEDDVLVVDDNPVATQGSQLIAANQLTTASNLLATNNGEQDTDSVTSNIDTEQVAEVAPVTVKLTMQFKMKSWLKVTDSTGKILTAKLYNSRKPLNVTGKPPLTMVLGRSYAVKRMSINGEAVKLADYKVSGRKYELR